MAEEREESDERVLVRGVGLEGDFEGFGGEELGDISCRGGGGLGRVGLGGSDGGGGVGVFFLRLAGSSWLAASSSLGSGLLVVDLTLLSASFLAP